MNAIKQRLTSALSELHTHFADDPELFHQALALVFSSIFHEFGHTVVVVGGQASSYWLRSAGSQDVDFVTDHFDEVRSCLCDAGFTLIDGTLYRLHHEQTDAMIELVGEQIEIASVTTREFVEFEPDDISDSRVRELVKKSGFIIDPALVFLNYLESSCESSIWYDSHSEGKLAKDRTQALWALYADWITDRLNELKIAKMWNPTDAVCDTVRHTYQSLFCRLFES